MTYVSGDTVIGFGHPMYAAGELQVPMVSGVVHTIYASMQRSSKIGAGGKLLGSLIQDRDACVVGKVGTNWQAKVKMIPVRINILNPKEKINQTANVEIVNHKIFTPNTLRRVIYYINDTLEPSWLRERMILVKVDVELFGGKKLHFENIYYEDESGDMPVGDGISEITSKIARVLNNEWQKVEIEKIDVVSEYMPNEGQAKLLKDRNCSSS